MVIGNGNVRSSQPVHSVVAGCTFADVMMFLVMHGIDSRVRAAAPLASMAVAADDYQILFCKPREQAIRITLRAHNACREAFRAVGMPVSSKEQVLLASDESAAIDVAGTDVTLAESRRKSARNLGIDFTLGTRRFAMVFASRAHKTKRKLLKLKAIRSAGVDSSHYTLSPINASHTYGTDCIGLSPSQVRTYRRAAHRSVTKSPARRSATFDLALSRAQPTVLDPSYRMNTGAIVTITSALWDEWVPRC